MKIILFTLLVLLGLSFAPWAGEPPPYGGGSTVMVTRLDAWLSPTGTGSGVHIGEDFILTANHVVVGTERVLVTTDLGALRYATVMLTDEENDIALLKLEEPMNFDTSPLACEIIPNPEPVILRGVPMGLDFAEVSGTMSTARIAVGIWDAVVIIMANVVPGMSGGPALDAGGHVVAIIVGYATNANGDKVGLVVPAEVFCGMLP